MCARGSRHCHRDLLVRERERVQERLALVSLSGIGHQCRDVMLERCRAGSQEAAEAPAGQGDLRWVALRPGECVVAEGQRGC
jgi:hypothetical protein